MIELPPPKLKIGFIELSEKFNILLIVPVKEDIGIKSLFVSPFLFNLIFFLIIDLLITSITNKDQHQDH